MLQTWLEKKIFALCHIITCKKMHVTSRNFGWTSVLVCQPKHNLGYPWGHCPSPEPTTMRAVSAARNLWSGHRFFSEWHGLSFVFHFPFAEQDLGLCLADLLGLDLFHDGDQLPLRSWHVRIGRSTYHIIHALWTTFIWAVCEQLNVLLYICSYLHDVCPFVTFPHCGKVAKRNVKILLAYLLIVPSFYFSQN